MQILHQPDPFSHCTYTLHKNRSFTDCRESYQNGACKETLILRWNGRIPTQEFVLHFLTVFTAKDIVEYRKKIFRVLVDNGLEAVTSIELTRGKNGRPNNTVHFHIITDDPRSEQELRQLLETACKRQGLVQDNDFCVDHRLLWDGYRYFNYFTKYGEKYFDKVILFQKGLLESGKTIQKFYTIGQWYQKGRGKIQIWDEIKAYCQEKYGTDIEETGSSDGIDLANVDDELTSEPPAQEVDVAFSLDVADDGNRVPMTWNECPTDYHLPKEDIRDRRKDWQRFKYSVSYLQ